MQRCRVLISLDGDMRHQVSKEVTVPELIVLETIHGAGSVTNIQTAGMDKRPHGEELARLRKLYCGRGRQEDATDVVSRLFPGHSPKLPVKLEDIGKSAVGEASKPKAKAKTPAQKAVENAGKKGGKTPAQKPEDPNPDDSGEGGDGSDDNPLG